ncbi:MAG TPA: hypothetical protein VD929_10815 [Caulobacteraceae bacterium]|nr:hypothetical protein [Caulobacteraceae bacterium]
MSRTVAAVFAAFAAVSAAGFAFAVGVNAQADEPVRLEVENATGMAMTALYLAPSATGRERNVLDDLTRAGETVEVAIGDLTDCAHEVVAEFEGGETIELRKVDLCALQGRALVVHE